MNNLPKLLNISMKMTYYKITCNDSSIKDVYVGRTNNFINRKTSHKSSCNDPKDRCYNLKVYKYIREKGGWTNWKMEIIEEGIFTYSEVSIREKYWIDKLYGNLNTMLAYKSKNIVKIEI